MWFFKKIVDVYYIILFEWFELFFVSGIFNRMVIILIYLLQKKKKLLLQVCELPLQYFLINFHIFVEKKSYVWKSLNRKYCLFQFDLEAEHRLKEILKVKCCQKISAKLKLLTLFSFLFVVGRNFWITIRTAHSQIQ